MKNATSIFVLLLAVAIPCRARTITVDDDAPADFNNIQAAIEDANNGDTIEIQPGTYTGDGNRDIDFLGKAITVTGTDPNDPNVVGETIVDCNRLGRGFYFQNDEDQNSVLEGLTVTNGSAPIGGGVYCKSSSPTICKSLINHNTTSRTGGYAGGGIACQDSNAVIFDCTITTNGTSGSGGGIYCSESNVTIHNCTLTGNGRLNYVYPITGSGLYATDSILTISDCNFGQADGGVIYLLGGNTLVTGCIVSGGTSDEYGGAITCGIDAAVTITNCLFSDNSADSAGGAIYCDTGSSLAITNSLFADNWADYVGGAIVFDEAAATLTDCVFRSNSTTERAGRSGGAIRAYSSTLKFTGCTFEDNHARTHGGAINADDCQLDFTNCLFANCSAPAGGAMHGYRNNITLANSRFVGNFAPFVSGAYRSMGGGLASSASTITLIDSLFVGNYALQYGGALFPGASDLTIENCTFAQNRAPVGNTLCIYPILYGDSPSWIHIENTIIWDGPNSIAIEDESTLLVAFSDIPGTVPGYGNIDADPCFIDPGRWVDSRDPNIVVDPNHMYAAWVNGDYHLKSQAGRYDPNTQTWVQDDVTSPCIDAGDPNSPLGPEPFPNGGRRNMGAYGGTTETSKSYFGKPPCETIVAGDINGDCIVNSIDYSLMAAHWLGRPVCPDLPARPSPPDHAEDVPLTQLLTWTPSCDATSYRIYFGTTSPARYQGRQEMVLFDPGTLEYNTTYYWHIEEVAPEGTITGPTWTFQTPFRRDPASNPDPYDGQTGVSVYPGLTWTPGIGAESHDVYFGETNPPTYAGNQTSTTYRPREPRRESGLEYSTTYYWRIDEVNPYGTTTGSVWIFRTGAPPDPATDPNPPNEANDVGASAVLSWTADANATSQKVYFSASNPPEFQGSQTETTFTPTALTPATTYYWRIDQVNSFGTTTGEVWTFTTGTTPPGQATNPEPPNDVNNLDPPIALSWSPGSDALSHDVYFGTTSPGEFKGNQAETTFNPGALSPGTAYYWRIDEVGYFGTTTGQVWTFTTGPLPAPPTNPDPADGAIDVGQTPSLSWTGGAGADSYDIYFGTMWDYKNRGNQTEATFDPGTLLPGTQYYWRIAEINIWGTTYGPEWTFTTAADD